jgi:hypothetical protein
MKVISKLLMFTLILSVFAGCKKDDDEDFTISGDYKGTISVVMGEANDIEIPDVSLTIQSTTDSTASIKIPAGSIPIMLSPINVTCSVKSNSDKYSLSSSSTTITVPDLGAISIEIANGSYVTKSGSIVLILNGEGEGITLNINFTGQKQ